MNYKKFFDIVRRDLFHGRLTSGQVDGMTRIIKYRDEKWPKMILEELAYLLATTKWETGHSMQPVEEGYPLTGEKLRAFQRNLRYAPAFGRGLVQITHPENYRKFGITNYEDALKWPTALHVLFEGCVKGMFTGHKLADYITPKVQDYKGARKVVNGTDRAQKIADIANKFLLALRAAEEKSPAPILEPVVEGKVTTGAGIIGMLVSGLGLAGVNLDLPHIPPAVFIGVIGFILVFLVGRKHKEVVPQQIEVVPEPNVPVEEEDDEMNIANVVQVVRTFIPIVERVIDELPKIREDLKNLRSEIEQLRNEVRAPESEGSDLTTAVSNLASKVSSIGGQ